MKLITKDIEKRLIENHKMQATSPNGIDPWPVVKIFDPCGAATWILTEYDPETGRLFGLCDLGFGLPELGYVDRVELEITKNRMGLQLERDRWWRAVGPLSHYVEQASRERRISA